MDTLAVAAVELVTFLFTDRGQRCCQPWSLDTTTRCSLYLLGKARKGISPKTQGKPPQGKQRVQLRSSSVLNKRGETVSEFWDLLVALQEIFPSDSCISFSHLYLSSEFCWAGTLSSLHHPAHKVSRYHTWEQLSKTTVFYCWPPSSSSGALVGWVFCSKVLLTVSVERGMNYAFSLPLPRVFQADWGFKLVEPSRHKPVCVCVSRLQ